MIGSTKRFCFSAASAVLLALSCLSVQAQVDEKAGAVTKDLASLQTNLKMAATQSGSLTGNPVYTRIFGSDVQNDCTATSTVSGSGVDVEYAAIPIYSPTGATLVASLDNPGTDIGDTVLSLYCNPFNPADPQANLVAYDDDGGSGLLSAFDGSEGIVLAPDTTYYLVVSLFSAGAIGGGNYELTVDGLSGGSVAFGFPAPEIIPTIGPVGLLLLVLSVGLVGFIGIRRFR